jgi:hypothetical protein
MVLPWHSLCGSGAIVVVVNANDNVVALVTCDVVVVDANDVAFALVTCDAVAVDVDAAGVDTVTEEDVWELRMEFWLEEELELPRGGTTVKFLRAAMSRFAPNWGLNGSFIGKSYAKMPLKFDDPKTVHDP